MSIEGLVPSPFRRTLFAALAYFAGAAVFGFMLAVGLGIASAGVHSSWQHRWNQMYAESQAGVRVDDGTNPNFPRTDFEVRWFEALGTYGVSGNYQWHLDQRAPTRTLRGALIIAVFALGPTSFLAALLLRRHIRRAVEPHLDAQYQWLLFRRVFAWQMLLLGLGGLISGVGLVGIRFLQTLGYAYFGPAHRFGVDRLPIFASDTRGVLAAALVGSALSLLAVLVLVVPRVRGRVLSTMGCCRRCGYRLLSSGGGCSECGDLVHPPR